MDINSISRLFSENNITSEKISLSDPACPIKINRAQLTLCGYATIFAVGSIKIVPMDSLHGSRNLIMYTGDTIPAGSIALSEIHEEMYTFTSIKK